MMHLTFAFREGTEEAESRQDDQWTAVKSQSLCLLSGLHCISALACQMPRHSNMFLNTTDGGLLRIPFWLELPLPPFHSSLVFLGSALVVGPDAVCQSVEPGTPSPLPLPNPEQRLLRVCMLCMVPDDKQTCRNIASNLHAGDG